MKCSDSAVSLMFGFCCYTVTICNTEPARQEYTFESEHVNYILKASMLQLLSSLTFYPYIVFISLYLYKM